MDILFLAPQPFYEERGTPIAVDLVLKGLSRRGVKVDVLTYHLGMDIVYLNVKIYRTPNLPFIRHIPPGFSWKKVFCDIIMFFRAIPLLLRKRYQYIHAVEEAVWIALILKILFKIPYIYDMDSSISKQMVERYPYLPVILSRFMKYMEELAIRNAKVVVPVCDALHDEAACYRPGKIILLRDISLLHTSNGYSVEDLRSLLSLKGILVLYVGNLEPYQGIDLLLNSFVLALKKSTANTDLVIIGGNKEDITKYRSMVKNLGILEKVHFLGPRPVEHLGHYLEQADILVSPRILGNNTPMKVYSYLDSGKPVLATNLATHTQVLTPEVAMLADPDPAGYSQGLLRLIENKELRKELGEAGKKIIFEKHSEQAFNDSLNQLYDWLLSEYEEQHGKKLRVTGE
jgi:glycosyltransferase involved in cell wall biosynthesis